MSNSFAVELWKPNGVLRQKQRKDFESTFLEYKEYVETYKRFPTATYDGTTDRGTSLYGWRAKIKNNKSALEFRDRLIEYEEQIGPELEKEYQNGERDRFYNNLLANVYPYPPGIEDGWYPTTFDEYLKDDNRFKYFDTRFYIEAMEYLNEPIIDCFNEIRLISAVFGERSWSFFYYEIGMKDLAKRVRELIETLDFHRAKEVLELRFGLGETRECKSLDEVKEIFSLSRERVRQIEAKALRNLRHPSRSKLLLMKSHITNGMMEEVVRNKIGHWFVLEVDGVRDDVVVSLPIEGLEEALALHGFDLDVPLPGYYVKSVTTRIEHELKLGGPFLNKIGLEFTGTNRGIEYTVIRILKDSPFDTIAYIKEMEKQRIREEERVQAEKARLAKLAAQAEIDRKREEEVQRLYQERYEREQERIRCLDEIRKGVQEVAPVPPREYERLKAQWKQDVQGMIKYIRFDDITWMKQINELIKVYQISADLLIMTQQVLLREIEFWGGKTDGLEFMVQCTNLGLDANDDYEFMYRMQLKRKR